MNYYAETKRYYGMWTGASVEVFDQSGVFLIQSSERDIVQRGYSRRFDLYALVRSPVTVVSYGTSLAERVSDLANLFSTRRPCSDLMSELRKRFDCDAGHALKFIFDRLPELDTSRAVQLRAEHYQDYRTFFLEQYPDTSKIDWLPEYFMSLVDRGYAWGVYGDGKLVSCTDAPDVPYMTHLIVEPGIATLRDYRNRGYAKTVCAALLKHLVGNGKVPIWSCDAGNLGSASLATSLGYRKFADLITLSLPG